MAGAADIIIRVRTDGVTGAEAALNRLSAAGVRTERVTDSMARAFERNNRVMQANNVAMGAMQTLGIVTFIGGMVGALAKLNDQYTSLNNKLVNANTANENLAVVQQRVFDIAQRSRTGLEATATLYARLERSLVQYGATAGQVARVTETVSKAMIVSGATTAEANAAIIQLSQGLQSGVLRGDEFRSVAEQAPRLLKAMADSLGVTTGELRALSMQGKLTADVVAKAIFMASDAIDKEFSRTIATFTQKLTVANNNLIKFAGTNENVNGATALLGDAILALSENMNTVATVVGVLALAFTGKLIGAMVSSQVASTRIALAQTQEIAVAKALTSARVQNSVAAVEAAAATLRAAEADKAASWAAVQAGQAYYKGVASLNAYMYAQTRVVTSTTALNAATATMNTTVATATARASALAVAMTGLRTVMGFLGGPMGVILIAASALYMWNSAQDQALEKSRNLATTTDDLRESLSKLTVENQKGLRVELARAEVKLVEQLAKEKSARDSLLAGVKNQLALSEDERQSTIVRNAARETSIRLEGDAEIAASKASTTEQQLSTVRANLKLVIDNLAAGERGLKAAVDGTNGSMNLATTMATKRSDDLTKALQAQNAEAEVAQLKLQGNARAASVLSDVQNRMPKVYEANKAFIDDLIAGHAGLTTVMTNEQLGLKEFIDSAGAAFDAQEKLRQNKKDEAQGKKDDAAALRYAEQWDKAYERVEARGATGIARLKIQQDAEIRVITDKATRAKATSEELGKAIVAIDTKYARLRADEADKYKPGAAMVRDFQQSMLEINQLRAADLLTEEQANVAKLNLTSQYFQKKAEMQKNLNPMGSNSDAQRSELDALQAQYTTALELAQGNEEQLTNIKENYEEQRYQIQLKYAQMQAASQNAITLSYMNSVSTMAGSMATVLTAAGAEGSAAYKVMFALSKGFAIAQATLNLSTAISQAMADPTALTPAQKFANMAAIAAAGASVVQQVMGATMTGMAHDGITNIPQEGTWLLQKGERVLSAQQNADFTSFMNGGNSNSGNATISTGGGGGATIIQHFHIAAGNGDEALRGIVSDAAKQGAEQGYAMVLNDVSSSRGDVSRAIGR